MLGKGGRACLCQCEPSGRAPLSFLKPGEFRDFLNWNFMMLFINYVVIMSAKLPAKWLIVQVLDHGSRK